MTERQPAPDDEAPAEEAPIAQQEDLAEQREDAGAAREQAEEEAADAIRNDLVELGFVSFDGPGAANATSQAMVSANRRRDFRRDVYVGIRDADQQREFLGRVVEGPFHAPHEVTADSAITRTTLLHPERTRFRPTYYAFGSIEVLGEIQVGERVIPTATRPRPYSELYIFPHDRLRTMLGISGDFYLGHLMGYERVQVHTDVRNKNFLPRNVGVFGTIGSGKSNTIQVMMEEALAAGWAVVAVDVEGEYVRMNEPTNDPVMAALLRGQHDLEPQGVADFRVYVPSAGGSDAQAPTTFKVPISGLEFGVLSDILEFSEPQIRMFGTVTANAARVFPRQGAGRLGVLAGGAAQGPVPPPYTLQQLIDGLTENQQGQIPLVPGNLRDYEKSTASVLRTKLINLGRSGMLDWNQTANVAPLPIPELLVAGRLSVLDVSETDDRSRNIAIAYTLQSLFDEVIETPVGQPMVNGVPRPRVLVVIEEVHTFVSRAAVSKMRSVMDSLQVISRRGRKRWMALALVSQQPSHVPDELFELANTRFIHQLKSAANLAPVRATTGGVHEALWSTIPALGSGQALLTGAVFRNPIFINVRPARSRRLLSGD
jgi:DNA helicase HerA-like ATPase